MNLGLTVRLGLSLIGCLMLTGCWDYERINERGQILAVGVDPMETGSGLKFTFQVPTFASGAGGGGGGGGQSTSTGSQASSTKDFSNYVVTAGSVDEAMSKAQTQSEKQFYMGNLQVVALSRDLKRKDVEKVVTELVRNWQADRLAHIVTTTEAAEAVLSAVNGIAPADKLDQMLGQQLHQHAFTTRERLWEFWRDAISTGIDPITSVVVTTPQGVGVNGSYAYQDMEPKMRVTQDDTLAMNAVRGQLERSNLAVQDGDGGEFTIGNLFARGHTEVNRLGNQFVIHVSIRLKGVLLHDVASGEYGTDPNRVRRYEAALSKQMKTNVEATLHRFQEEQLDVFGFGREWLVQHPNRIDEMKRNWREDFKNARIECEVRSSITSKGSLM